MKSTYIYRGITKKNKTTKIPLLYKNPPIFEKKRLKNPKISKIHDPIQKPSIPEKGHTKIPKTARIHIPIQNNQSSKKDIQ